MSTLFDLTGKTALVTGGSKGLGKAMARAFAEQGADVFISSRHEDELRSAIQEITEGTSVRGAYAVADLSRREESERLAQAACLGPRWPRKPSTPPLAASCVTVEYIRPGRMVENQQSPESIDDVTLPSPLEIATRFPQFHSPDDDDISPTNKKHKGTLLSSYRGGHFYWALTPFRHRPGVKPRFEGK